jgi:hypothetical protein
MGLAGDVTLEQARDWLRQRTDEGARCPCCTQFAKVYKRAINSGMARALVTMYRVGGEDWLHKPTVLRGLGAAARDEALLRYWGLVEEEVAVRPDGGRTGWWRVTPKGGLFVLNVTTVQKYALVYDSRCLGLDGPQVSIVDALGTKFNLNDLMAGR